MTIAAILNHKGRSLIHVPPTATVSKMVAILREHRIGAVLVLDPSARWSALSDRHILGIVSERDIIRALAAMDSAGDVLDMTAAQIMTELRSTIPLSATLADAAVLMTERRIRHLPVVDGEALVGLVSIGDVIKAGLLPNTRSESLRTAFEVTG
jgi:CBS domain-containing protein